MSQTIHDRTAAPLPRRMFARALFALFVCAALAGSPLAQVERDRLVAGMLLGTETRATVLRKIAESPEFTRRETNRAFVFMQYLGYLRRAPNDPPDSDFSGLDFWLSKLEEFGGDYRRAEMVKAFVSSIEYRARFSTPAP